MREITPSDLPNLSILPLCWRDGSQPPPRNATYFPRAVFDNRLVFVDKCGFIKTRSVDGLKWGSHNEQPDDILVGDESKAPDWLPYEKSFPFYVGKDSQ